MQLCEEDFDYSVAERHVKSLDMSPYFYGSAISIYDNVRRHHIYESEYHKVMFCDDSGIYGGVTIHPDDMESVMKNAIAVMRHIFTKGAGEFSKLIREYRAMVKGEWRRISEEIQILESDGSNRPWLALSIANISPNQNPPYNVVSKLVNLTTGDVFTPLDEYFDTDRILSARESEILLKISQGFLSKEIAEMLDISINTVNNHRQNILRKLKVDNSIEAVNYAMTMGLIRGL